MTRKPASTGIGQPFSVLEATPSTNNYAMGQAESGLARHGAAWFARAQTAGKGQRGKSWITEPGQNIILSVLLEPALLRVSEPFHLSLACSLAAADLMLEAVKDAVFVKWPNDIYWNDRKAAGLLLENRMAGNSWHWCVAGFGMNVNQVVFDPAIPNPVSLRQITGKTFDPVELAHRLCQLLDDRCAQGFDALLENFNALLWRRGQVQRFRKENAAFNAVILGVDRQGRLLLGDSPWEAVEFGDVVWG